MVRRVSNINEFRNNEYEITKGLWKGIAVPNLMYGMKVLPIKG